MNFSRNLGELKVMPAIKECYFFEVLIEDFPHVMMIHRNAIETPSLIIDGHRFSVALQIKKSMLSLKTSSLTAQVLCTPVNKQLIPADPLIFTYTMELGSSLKTNTGIVKKLRGADEPYTLNSGSTTILTFPTRAEGFYGLFSDSTLKLKISLTIAKDVKKEHVPEATVANSRLSSHSSDDDGFMAVSKDETM